MLKYMINLILSNLFRLLGLGLFKVDLAILSPLCIHLVKVIQKARVNAGSQEKAKRLPRGIVQ